MRQAGSRPQVRQRRPRSPPPHPRRAEEAARRSPARSRPRSPPRSPRIGSSSRRTSPASHACSRRARQQSTPAHRSRTPRPRTAAPQVSTRRRRSTCGRAAPSAFARPGTPSPPSAVLESGSLNEDGPVFSPGRQIDRGVVIARIHVRRRFGQAHGSVRISSDERPRDPGHPHHLRGGAGSHDADGRENRRHGFDHSWWISFGGTPMQRPSAIALPS